MVSYRSGDVVAPRLDTREALAVEVENALGAITGKSTLVAGGWAGWRIVRVLEAAQRSSEQGGAVVALPGAVGRS